MRPEPHGVSGTRKLSIPGMASGHWGTPAAAADFLARAFAPPRVRVLRARVVRGVESTFSRCHPLVRHGGRCRPPLSGGEPRADPRMEEQVLGVVRDSHVQPPELCRQRGAGGDGAKCLSSAALFLAPIEQTTRMQLDDPNSHSHEHGAVEAPSEEATGGSLHGGGCVSSFLDLCRVAHAPSEPKHQRH